MAPDAPSRAHDGSRRSRVLGWLLALGCVLLGATLRVHATFEDPNFDAADPRGMLRSDPGLLYYLTERIVESRGATPEDYRADPRVEHPELTDVPATFSVGQEFAIAWSYRLLGGDAPLHDFCAVSMAVWASLTALFVYGLALELSGRATWATFAAALFVCLPANYRTVGWILMREDFSLPWLALHGWLLARAARVRSPGSVALAALALAAAVATWHATRFLAAIEAFVVLAWYLRTGRNPLAAPWAWIFPAVLAAAALVVPVLRSTAFVLSIPMQIVLAMLVAAKLPTRWRRSAAVLAWAALATAAWGWSAATGEGIGEYGHVFALLAEKVRHLGRLPADPTSLPVEARLMWQGPFATLGWVDALRLLGVSLLGLVPAARAVALAARQGARRDEDPRWIVLAGIAWAAIPVAWLVERTVILPGIALPVVAAVVLSRTRGLRPARTVTVGLLLATQAAWCVRSVESRPNPWYLPWQRQVEIRELVERIPDLVPEGEAVAADFVNSTAILAHTRRPIVFQPKWESRRSRERAIEFLTTFFHGTPEAMRELLLGKYRCRYVVFDRMTLGILVASRYVAGYPARWSGPEPGTCAAVFLSQDGEALASVPGYRLLYRSPPTILQSDGSPADFFRLYALEP